MKNQTYVILALIFVIFIAIFSVLNVSPVEVNYLFWKGESPLVIVILISVLLGGILTTAVGTGKFIQMRRDNNQLMARVKHLEQAIEQQTEASMNGMEEIEDEWMAEERNDREVE